MGFQVNMPTLFSICAFFFVCLSPATSDIDATFQSSLGSFSGDLFEHLYQLNDQKSIIYSPFSIQACLAMLRMGADGQTATELDQGLRFGNQNAQVVADNYHSLLAKYQNSDILKIANKIYVAEQSELNENYKDVLSNKFFSSAENMNFAESGEAASVINSWVESVTDKMITNLVSENSFDASTRMFLLSAIYFNGKWETAFPKGATHEEDFFTHDTNTVKVQMMELRADLQHYYSEELHTKVVLLPYKDSNLSMLVMVPTKNDGLPMLQQNLKTVSLPTILNKMTNKKVHLSLPKFKAKSEFKLKSVLEKMGMGQMFGHANLSKMLKSSEPLVVGKVIHKAIIEVGEEGTKAAAVTGIGAGLRSSPVYQNVRADHPFYYAIIDEDAVPMFQGTFVGV